MSLWGKFLLPAMAAVTGGDGVTANSIQSFVLMGLVVCPVGLTFMTAPQWFAIQVSPS